MGRLPEVKAFLIADTVLQEKFTNKWSVVGVFDRVASPAYPTVRPSIGIYVKLADANGTYRFAIEFRDSEDRRLNRADMPPLTVGSSATTFDFGIQTPPLQIPAPGRYHFVLFINDELAQMVPIDCVKMDAPPGFRPPGAPPP